MLSPWTWFQSQGSSIFCNETSWTTPQPVRKSCLDVLQVWFKPFLIKESTLCTSYHVLTTADQNVTLPTSHLRTMNINRDFWNVTLTSVHLPSDQGEENAIQTVLQSVPAFILRPFYREKHVPPRGRENLRQIWRDLKTFTHENNSTLWHKCIASKSTEQYRVWSALWVGKVSDIPILASSSGTRRAWSLSLLERLQGHLPACYFFHIKMFCTEEAINIHGNGS